jgi:hypothetical protein
MFAMDNLSTSSALGRQTNPLKAALLVGVGLAMGLLVGVGMVFGAMFAIVAQLGHASNEGGSRPLITLPETALHAVATDAGDTFSIATGPIDDEVEGLFTLDFLTGDLQCLVVNPRTAAWSVFRYNVLADLGTRPGGKAAQLLMVTGMWSTRVLGAGATRPANSVVYVADAVSGNVGVYAVPWNRSIPATGRTQEGALVQVGLGKARNVVER